METDRAVQLLDTSSQGQLVPPTPGAALSPRARRSVEQVVDGLGRIAAAPSLTAIYAEATALLSRLPKVTGVAAMHRDERGLLTLVHLAGAQPPAGLEARVDSALHQRWIAAHGVPGGACGVAPFELDSAEAALVVPMVEEDALTGAFVLLGDEAGGPLAATPAERLSAAAVGVVTAQAVSALSLRQRLESSISCAEHDEEMIKARKSLSRELHDGPTQELALAGMALDRLLRTVGHDERLATDARQARDLIDRAVTGMRMVIGRLRAPYQAAPSVTGPLRSLVAEMTPASPELAGLQVDFQEVSGLRLAPEIERAMVGIVREALHNVRKHAQADSVRLEVKRVADEVEIAVCDDGVGFTGESPAGHFGLEQIRELAEASGGRLQVGSEPGAGTTVRAWVPATSAFAAGEPRARQTAALRPSIAPPAGPPGGSSSARSPG